MDAVTGKVRRIRAKRAPDGGWAVSTRLTPSSRTDPVEIVLGDCPEHCKIKFYELNTNVGIYRISKESFEYVLRTERYMAQPYVPGGKSDSGVTIGYGYDLGHQSSFQARSDLSGLIESDDLEKLLAVVGRKGEDATAVVADVDMIDMIEMSQDNALELAMRMKQRYAQSAAEIYPEALDLHPHCQGALPSLVINRGASLSSRDSRREIREIQMDLTAGNPENVPERLRSMKRLWEGKGLGGLLSRREQEAVFFERGRQCDCWE